ncbi:MAG: hypothetical protein M0033_07850, partial [Nitrospiraceae bacterium]|nr:hypothetical protein [Nitrospiraceae bacterium]
MLILPHLLMHPVCFESSLNIDKIYGIAVYLIMSWEFIELPPFAELRDKLFSDEEFRDLQIFLIDQPKAGDVIPETGGCRKLR